MGVSKTLRNTVKRAYLSLLVRACFPTYIGHLLDTEVYGLVKDRSGPASNTRWTPKESIPWHAVFATQTLKPGRPEGT
jgi:hypothetical protein